MPQTPHTETHFTGGELVRDTVIGMSDGLTVCPSCRTVGTLIIGALAAGAAYLIARWTS